MKGIAYYITESIDDPARIFIIIKPGFFKYTQQILEYFRKEGWVVEKQRSKRLLLKEARQLYKIHKDEDWYKDLCIYMSSDITTAFILKNEDLKMSPKIFEGTSSIKDVIRKEYGESDMRNVIHSSDSPEHMRQEQSIYF